IGGELGSHRVARVWHDTHHASLFDWDEPAPPGTPVPDWGRDFVDAGGILEHRDYMGPDEAEILLPRGHGLVRRKVSGLHPAPAETLMAHALDAASTRLRGHVVAKIADTLPDTLRTVKDKTIIRLLGRVVRENDGDPRNPATLGDVKSILQVLFWR